jgi:acyl-homoserine lactone acylase PvdQ
LSQPKSGGNVKIISRTLLFAFIVLIPLAAAGQETEQRRWERFARNVTITRDNWGIAHVKGRTDADAVFGAMYAQAEDDFNRIETNYLNSIGRLAEAEGEQAIWSDLRQRLFIDEQEMKRLYLESPEWLRKLMNAWADGLNFYLATHPNVKPRVITKFEPWMPLTFSEGSIGGDIESVNTESLRGLYSYYVIERDYSINEPLQPIIHDGEDDVLREPSGSNGIAISPANTKGKNALLLINPHTSFFFRSELQMTSDEGLNAYGASTWGQFFIYQGFNERLGWMHTSSAVDAIDEFVETFVKNSDGKFYYVYGDKERPIIEKQITVRYKGKNRELAERTFKTFYTHHGPIVRSGGLDKWISVGLMNEPVKALMQSYGRTKAKNYDEFKKVMELQANSSNATIYADADGNTAYFHPNFVPRRDPKFDWTRPVDGSDPAADWKGLHSFDELPNLKNPASGWLYNSNDWPWSAAGPSSLKQENYPKYVDSGNESARGRHAVRVLENRKDFTLDSLTAAAYDSYLPWFEKTIPALIRAWERTGESPARSALTEQISELRRWDLRWSTSSVPTSLAVLWAEDISRRSGASARQERMPVEKYVAEKASGEMLLASLTAVSERLTRDFGSWKTPWGEINRFQRLTGDIAHPFSDSAPSIPVGFTSGNWGSLASFGARPYKGSKKYYGTSGNSFVAVVEFGKKVRARAVSAGGESGDPKSPHFNDQAERYAVGNLRPVYFYPEDLKGRTKAVYRPGDKGK